LERRKEKRGSVTYPRPQIKKKRKTSNCLSFETLQECGSEYAAQQGNRNEKMNRLRKNCPIKKNQKKNLGDPPQEVRRKTENLEEELPGP